MNSIRRKVMILAGAALALSAMSVAASDPIGIYAIVEKVIIEPNEAAPQRIQVWGAFALAVQPVDSYTAPARGYMYFTLPSGNEATAKKEWADLKSVAGSGQGIAFAARYGMLGTVRKAGDKIANPDVYPIGGNGVVKVHPYAGYQDNMTSVINKLKALAKS
jgi:hypothetical protein